MHSQLVFDTLRYVNYLEDHGFTSEQAEGLLEAQIMVSDAQEAKMATKHDLELVQVRLEKKIDLLDGKIDRKIDRAVIFLFSSLVGIAGVVVASVVASLNIML